MCFLGRFRIKRSPSIPAASPSRDTGEVVQDSNVQIFMASAADEIAADIFDQPSCSTSKYTCQREDESRDFSSIYCKYNAPPLVPNWRRLIQEVAATKIQNAFRGYLARKVARALKGIVRLQATIRGILVRRQARKTLNKLQSIANIQSQVRAKRSQMLDDPSCSKDKDIKIDLKSQRRWDDSLLTKEEENDLCSSKRMAAIKRERIKQFSFRNRRPAGLEQNKIDGRWRYWLEQCVDTRISKREDLQNLVSVFSTRERIKHEEPGKEQVKSQNLQKQCHYKESELPATRLVHLQKQHPIGNRYSAGGGSLAVPTYMAATVSAKAKVRSMSSPRLRPMSFNSNSVTFSPYKHKSSPISSINSDLTTISMFNRPSHRYSQRSPCLEGPVSKRNSK
ncbi:protein IQ-DOMAIN 11 [Daucus carota subsp. sativus]|uniref:protein IQ-DOMAIN 11 n=1 Tax=Daucus carota subsp. sativus TaxID=79200 RepID=UPI0007EF36AE|nr:PREDICTED: protein IQ-DOMAIN 14 [Daucus carota subsp. sativus]